METIPRTTPVGIGRPGRLLDVRTIFHEPAVAEHARGREILDRFPEARRIAVPSHWNIPALHGNPAAEADWATIKRTTLVLGVKKDVACRPFYRSTDFVAPSHANGCTAACAYCYVARRKGSANPITTFVNIGQILDSIQRHALRQGMKLTPTQADPALWVYEIGTNNDCAVDALVSDNVRDLVDLFRRLPNAKATFATKFVNRDLLGYDPQGRTRLRFSLLPPDVSRILDVRTAAIADRVVAVDDFVAAGYEVNLNFGPVVYADGWLEGYAELFALIDDALSPRAKAQLQAEVIFLTHSERAHELNLRWHPAAEKLLWRPELQEGKTSQAGGENLRYRRDVKRGLVSEFLALLADRLPYCRVRYAF
ncbi:MAG: Spore photoproduct lyase [uncultured Thermomicrobiales bacterium]|uniref:Spore photoproduct lyase n=1 Tax=uncultured Thermomicrobiales bacterium TaxID=1645740 RepID=A0A6J4VQN2_9BACT|nr:MAG: Spore photoproduct lyase [uncultured Thermomicrobiales bacterium]